MTQKTDLNISPYYDDFDPQNNFYKVLFKPGFPVQARELTTLQSILQNQIQSFGSHIFKDGSVVIPGGISYDAQFFAVKLSQTNLGVDVSLYIDKLIGKKITGATSGTTATVQFIAYPDDINVEDLTIYVKYLDSDENFEINQFQDGESLVTNENITYGSSVINADTPFATLVSADATSIGSAASISEGVYFIRGFFVDVSKETIILDHYTNTPSYRVGLKIDETIVSAKDDDSLYDNAKGFTNYAAPGADRLKISLSLTKKLLTDFDDTDFVELLRVEEGKIRKSNVKTAYNLIRDYMAQRTYDESGDYSVIPFVPSIHNSLNNRLGNNGLFFEDETTNQGNTPSDDLMCIKVSPGKAYVRGYDVEKISTTILDVEKPRDTQTIENVSIPFEMGNILRVNNVSGVARQNGSIDLYNRFNASGTKVGDARVYACNLTDAAYTNAATNWDLYLYDIQTYTKIDINSAISTSDLPATSYVKGKSSGASGYAVSDGNDQTTIFLRQTSGTFSVGEQLVINGNDFSRSITSVISYGIEDIKSVQQSSSSGYPQFDADSVLSTFLPPNSIDQVTITTGGNVTSPGKVFTGIKTDTIIRYQKSGATTETFNRVDNVSADGLSLTVSAISPSVTGVFEGTLPGSDTQTSIKIGAPVIRNRESGYLYADLPDFNIASVDLSDSNLLISEQLTGQTISGNSITINVSDFTGITSSFFAPFDEERYSVHYNGGGIGTVTSDSFSINTSSTEVTLSGLTNGSNVVINATLIKNGVQSKLKEYTRSSKLNVNLSKNPQSGSDPNNSINDGLTYNQYYGLRVQDEEISLNYPDVVKVISVFESLDTASPTLDQIQLSSSANVSDNAIIGENVRGLESNAIARVVSKFPTVSANNVEIVYLTEDRFISGESVVFDESNITTELQNISLGSYKDITDSFFLNKGQKDQYYDYSRIIRNPGSPEPSRRLLIVFDYYSIPSEDNGDLFTVLSYDQERFSTDIPVIGSRSARATDTLDFRPRVSVFSGISSSPFDFSSRDFSSNPELTLSPNESSLVGYSFYLPRVDKLYLDKFGNFIVEKGVSAKDPKAPTKNDSLMELATINLPPYLYNPQNAKILLVDSKRYTMRDIGLIEDRVENLERITSLSFLEVNTQTLEIQDAEGRNRFKSGFFVDDFKNYSLINTQLSSVNVNPVANELTPIVSRNSLKSRIAPAANITDESIDFSDNFELLDPNVQKTGDSITLKYEEIDWIEQPFATRVENVNPFNVVVYIGEIELHPEIDTWVRTVQLPDKNINITNNSFRTLERNLVSNVTVNNTPVRTSSREDRGSGDQLRDERTVIQTSTASRTETTRSQDVSLDTISNTDVSSRNILVASFDDTFMRSRNTEFVASNLKPSTRFYQFLDGTSGVDFIPKLVEISNDSTLENYGASKAFAVGETVIGSFGNRNLIRFRVCRPDHKEGNFSSPSKTFNINPYVRTESIPSAYNQSSKVLNVDTRSLSEEAQGRYSGYLVKGMKLVGQSSGAIAYVKDLRLISDNYGDLIGSFFLRNPNASPVPAIRIPTGTKNYKLSSSKNNDDGLRGSNSVSRAETNYNSDGTVEQYQREVTTITNNLTTRTVTNLTTNTTTNTTTINRHRIFRWEERPRDPLAQSFTVGGQVEAPSSFVSLDDENGVYLTSVDLFFARKDEGNAPVEVQIREVELGTPTRTIIGKTVTLRPDEVNISDNAEVPTRVTFPEPIYLAPGNEYAIVLVAETSDQYEVWIAQMGENTVNTQSLPDAESVKYSKQFAMGSLFKSQNGSIWTADQYQDMKFKLYKARFTSTTGTAFIYNPTLDESNGYVPTLLPDSLISVPKTATIGIDTTTNATLTSDLSAGRKISGIISASHGFVDTVGGPVSTVGLTTGGLNYVSDSDVETYNIIGSGSGLRLNISATNGIITGTPSIVSSGSGYAVGDVVGIVTSSVSSSTGRDARISITATSGVDTLYLSGVQGQVGPGNSFVVGAGLSYYDNTGNIVSLASTTITSASSPSDERSGNYLRVLHFNHGMYSNTNQLTLSGVESDVPPTTLSTNLLAENVTTINVTDATSFEIFEGVPVGASNPGYVKIENEIIAYTSADTSANTLTIAVANGRGIDSTLVLPHDVNSLVYKYELNGVSLRRINKNHDISDLGINNDAYFVEIDRSSNGVDRSVDTSIPQLSFNSLKSLGGANIKATENILFTGVVPTYDMIVPGNSTSVSANIRTVTGTSVDGNETSFLDNGFEPVQLNSLNLLDTSRIVCSNVNESTYLSFLPRNKSFTTGITLNTEDQNLSPIIYLDTAFTEFTSNRMNNPISDYAQDNRVNSVLDDPHAAVYVSNTVNLAQPASSLKVILSAYRHASADFRVLYSLIREDSSEVGQSFELFPGYKNLRFAPGSAVFEVIDPAKNNGEPDVFVSPSLEGQFREYEFTAENLNLFIGYTIKIVMSGTNSAQPPRIKELRSIAIR